jgi:DNA-binding NarL/FixJ family response regulator
MLPSGFRTRVEQQCRKLAGSHYGENAMRQEQISSAAVNKSLRVENDDTCKLNKMKSSAGKDQKQALVLALIDPKPLTRRSILEALTKALPDYTNVAASSCEELLDMPGKPHFVIIHTRSTKLTDTWVQNILKLVRLHLPDALVVLLSDRDDVDDVVKALSVGVRGYIPTSVRAEVAIAALRLIDAGGTFIPAHVFPSAAPEIGSDYMHRRVSNEIALTPRELSVVALLREGKPNKLIAAQLEMAVSTVKVHVRNILKKLRVTNRTHAAFVASRMFCQPPSTAVASPRQSSDSRSDLLTCGELEHG